jgi:transposase
VQVADRWHLLKNLSETVERRVTRKHRFVRQAAQAVIVPPRSLPEEEENSQEAPVMADTPLTRAGSEIAERHERRLARYTEALELRRQRVSVRVIARTVGVCTRTIRRWACAEGIPSRITAQRQSILHAFMPDLKRRWEEGCHNASQLWRELSMQGFNGSSQIVRYHVARWRAQLPVHLRYTRGPQSNGQPQTLTPPSPRRVGWLLLKKDEALNIDEQAFVAKLCSLSPEIEAARRLAQEFSRMVRHRQVEALAGWLDEAQKSSLPEFRSLATGLQRDRQAVEAALSCEWGNGQVEGQVNRLKLIKRQMYGRANFDLLRARVLHAA